MRCVTGVGPHCPLYLGIVGSGAGHTKVGFRGSYLGSVCLSPSRTGFNRSNVWPLQDRCDNCVSEMDPLLCLLLPSTFEPLNCLTFELTFYTKCKRGNTGQK